MMHRLKQRPGESSSKRRPLLKKPKISDGIYNSILLYVKFMTVWFFVLLADYLLEFRVEYFWPAWLLIRSIGDSFKYHGLAFSMFFVCVAITSDVLSYLLIPLQTLFFAASSYVWAQYIWNTGIAERGICVPTVVLCLLLVYIEASVRIKDLKTLSSLRLSLSRPFAAHCIGYPVVSLGFGFKSVIACKMRQRRQKDIEKDNQFYYKILSEALPEHCRRSNPYLPNNTHADGLSNGTISVGGSGDNSSSDQNQQGYNNSKAVVPAGGAGGGGGGVDFNPPHHPSGAPPHPSHGHGGGAAGGPGSSGGSVSHSNSSSNLSSSTAPNSSSSSSLLCAPSPSAAATAANSSHTVRLSRFSRLTHFVLRLLSRIYFIGNFVALPPSISTSTSESERLQQQQEEENSQYHHHHQNGSVPTGHRHPPGHGHGPSGIEDLLHPVSSSTSPGHEGSISGPGAGGGGGGTGHDYGDLMDAMNDTSRLDHRRLSGGSSNSGISHSSSTANGPTSTGASGGAGLFGSSPVLSGTTGGGGTLSLTEATTPATSSYLQVDGASYDLIASGDRPPPRSGNNVSSTDADQYTSEIASREKLVAVAASACANGAAVNSPPSVPPLSSAVSSHTQSYSAPATTGPTTSTGPKSNKHRDLSVNLVNKSASPSVDLPRIQKFESDIRKLRSEVSYHKNVENDLRSQISRIQAEYQDKKYEVQRLKSDIDDYQNKIQTLTGNKQQDKQALSKLERQLEAEKRAKNKQESELAAERKLKKELNDEIQRLKELAASNKKECSESCQIRTMDKEVEIEKVRQEKNEKDNRISQLVEETENLHKFEHEVEVLMSALQAMQEKNSHLESSLDAENRHKMEILMNFTTKSRNLEFAEARIADLQQQIDNMRIAQQQQQQQTGGMYQQALGGNGAAGAPGAPPGPTKVIYPAIATTLGEYNGGQLTDTQLLMAAAGVNPQQAAAAAAAVAVGGGGPNSHLNTTAAALQQLSGQQVTASGGFPGGLSSASLGGPSSASLAGLSTSLGGGAGLSTSHHPHQQHTLVTASGMDASAAAAAQYYNGGAGQMYGGLAPGAAGGYDMTSGRIDLDPNSAIRNEMMLNALGVSGANGGGVGGGMIVGGMGGMVSSSISCSDVAGGGMGAPSNIMASSMSAALSRPQSNSSVGSGSATHVAAVVASAGTAGGPTATSNHSDDGRHSVQ